ncbi:MAG TPA: type III-A CRISPR-associated RAMP protein Csm5 [Eubacteriaceae bacterium]|nr:type III-A CRISPR-associated RAMP protein Csm5 [Eubacteriaceae bacterium]
MKNYTITLETLTPVYIGSGKKITKKDFKLEKDYAYIYDPIKLHSILGISYENFLTNSLSLTDYLGRNQHFNISSALKYFISIGDKTIRKSDSIDEFLKDPYGYPYIPGSSIKGAIRTALLAYRINNEPSKYARFKSQSIDKWRNNGRDIEIAAFGNPQDSKFKNLRISDSKPIPKDSLILSKKIDIFKDGESNNKLNLCRESICPGTKVYFDLTIEKDEFSIEEIIEAIKFFSRQYRENYLSKFNSFGKEKYEDNIIYLGGGTGFLTKTVNQSLYGAKTTKEVSQFLNKAFKWHKHYRDIEIGLSPRAKKCTKINGKTMEMGISRIRID